MKKSSFVAMVLGTVSGVLFALGMCMALQPEWDAFRPGVILGCVGLLAGLLTVFVWRKMEHKAPLRITGRSVAVIAITITGTLALGIGMCFCMIWGRMMPGVLIGTCGIFVLLGLIPAVKGIK